MKRTILICDNCGKQFVDKYEKGILTINDKAKIEVSLGRKQKSNEAQTVIIIDGGFINNDDSHFCDIHCFNSYVEKKIEKYIFNHKQQDDEN